MIIPMIILAITSLFWKLNGYIKRKRKNGKESEAVRNLNKYG